MMRGILSHMETKSVLQIRDVDVQEICVMEESFLRFFLYLTLYLNNGALFVPTI